MLPADHALAAPDALLALGRLDGALSMARPATLRLFVLRLLRDMLVTALRQEGHSFTDHRFHAWFAGVATLSDELAPSARPPRALCEAMLTELMHNSWDLLSEAATRLQSALLAPSDHVSSGLAVETAHQDAGAVIAAASDLIAGLPPSPHPLAAVTQLHHAVVAHVLFAPSERAAIPIAIGPITTGALRLTVERMALPSPRWALEMLWGEYWRKTGQLTHALPFPGLVRLDALFADSGVDRAWDIEEIDSTPNILAATLGDVAQGLNNSLDETDRLARRLADCQPGKRRSSRAPALLELLAGFGPLRSAQLETMLGVTRLGLRTMLGAVNTAGMLARTTLAGVHLYALKFALGVAHGGKDLSIPSTFSPAVLDEYNAAMTDIEALLARSPVNLGRAEEEDEP